jgi:Ca-activated chloride channel family protein
MQSDVIVHYLKLNRMKTLIAKYLLIASLFIMGANQKPVEYGSLGGKVVDAETNEPIIYGPVTLYKNGKQVAVVQTDIDGNYFFEKVLPGSYNLEVSYVGYQPENIENILISVGKSLKLDIKLKAGVLLGGVEVVAYSVPLMERSSMSSGRTISSEEIRSLPLKDINRIAAKTSGISVDESKLSVRGARINSPDYYIDGVRVKGAMVPKFSEEENNESYSNIKENIFYRATEEPLSTFSLDVDRAAYSNVRRFINGGDLPPADAVRIEEMVNYFQYDYPAPKNEDVLAVSTQLTDCPWNPELRLLHIGVQSQIVDFKDLPVSNLVFLIDVSGSMQSQNKLPLLVSSFKLLLNQLRPEDKVAIVTYAGNAGIALPSTPVSNKQKILECLDGLTAGGSTAGAQGIITAYEIAKEHFIESGNNRVILATDGDFNVGISDNNSLEKLIEEKRESGIFLSVLGYGMGNYKDDKMQILANKGNGNHAYIDDLQEAKKVLVSEFGGTVHTLAKDVKFQLEFNPALVDHYRLVGYENRLLAKEDFNNDAKDAGELGMGHQMTAIYEVAFHGAELPGQIDPLKYKKKSDKSQGAEFMNELATIKFRYKEPKGMKSKKWEQVVRNDHKSIRAVNDDIRFSIAVAHAGMLLREMSTLLDKNYQPMIELASSSKGTDKDGYRAEFVRLMQTANELVASNMTNNSH